MPPTSLEALPPWRYPWTGGAKTPVQISRDLSACWLHRRSRLDLQRSVRHGHSPGRCRRRLLDHVASALAGTTYAALPWSVYRFCYGGDLSPHGRALARFMRRAVKRCREPRGCKSRLGNCRYTPVATEAAGRATDLLKLSGHRPTLGGSASRRAATRVKPEQASKVMS
jgi:hypothetical protein